jgi:Lon protease-like protein
MITLSGMSRFRVPEIEGFTPYRRARVNWAGLAHLGGEERTPV